MPKKRQYNNYQQNVPQKKSRFGVLANFDDGDRDEKAGCSNELTADEKVEGLLNKAELRGSKKPSISITKAELTLNDIARMCHSFVAKNESTKPLWLTYNNCKLPSQMVFVRVNCSEEQLRDEEKKSVFRHGFYKKWTPVNEEAMNLNLYWDKLLHVYVPKRIQLKAFFEKQKDPLKELQISDVLKLALLTTTEDMAGLNYPLHGFDQDEIPGVLPVVPTKEYYAKVGKDSPIFVLDCEMCVTEVKLPELTRVTLIDEEGNTLIDTYVKPVNKIIDYVTCFSGVTEESLRGVSVRLSHVQDAFRRILPPDAILCAHSIENDLKALRMSHPYCIDVGFAYNMINKKMRTSLRGLMYYYFNERIQCSDLGHCSYEDAWAALRLLKLKLDNGLEFGSISLGFNYVEWAKTQNFTECAQLFQISTARDFAKGPYKQVKLPEPRQIGQCVKCETMLSSQCYIDKCLCVERSTKYCCLCVGHDIKHAKLDESEQFNFGKALSVLKEVCYRPTMQEILKTYRKPARAMLARYLDGNENSSELSDKNVHTYDMNKFASVKQIEQELFDEKILSHDLCLLEYNTQSMSIADVDDYLRALHQRMGANGILGVMFCSPEKVILQMNIKIP